MTKQQHNIMKIDNIGINIENAKNELYLYIKFILAKYNIPIYLFTYILNEIYIEIINQKDIQLINDRKKWMDNHPLIFDKNIIIQKMEEK